MGKTSSRLIATAAMFLAAIPGGSALCNDLVVRLQDRALAAPDQLVRLGDIAVVSGGSPMQRRTVEGLDLEAQGRPGSTSIINRRQVEVRIQVAGLRRSQFRVEGAATTQVVRANALQFRTRLESELANEIAKQFGLVGEHVEVQLMDQQQVGSIENQLQSKAYQVRLVLTSSLPLGEQRLRVLFDLEDGQRINEWVRVQVIVSRQVAVAAVPIPLGTRIQPSMFELVDRPILKNEQFADPDALVGKVASQAIQSHQVILATHTSANTTSQATVRRNSLIDVIVPIGANQVRLKNAKVLSTGKPGDTIVVMNTKTQRQFSAVLVDQRTARVEPIIGRKAR